MSTSFEEFTPVKPQFDEITGVVLLAPVLVTTKRVVFKHSSQSKLVCLGADLTRRGYHNRIEQGLSSQCFYIEVSFNYPF